MKYVKKGCGERSFAFAGQSYRNSLPDDIYLFICSNMVQHKQLLKQLHEQDNKAVINSTDSCSIYSYIYITSVSLLTVFRRKLNGPTELSDNFSNRT